MTFIYTDASSAILLYKADLFSDLSKRWAIIMAHEVFKEITRPGYPGADFFKTMADSQDIRIFNENLSPPETDLDGFDHLDKGEQETLCCYFARPDRDRSFVLIDDGKGARFCGTHRIPFINALLVPKLFWYSGFMGEVCAKKKMNHLAALGRYSKAVRQKAKALSRTDLFFFIPNGRDHG